MTQREEREFAHFEANARALDLSPWQCRTARRWARLELDVLADLAALDEYEIADFEAQDERGGGLTICERFKIVKALASLGVAVARRGACESVWRVGEEPQAPLWEGGPSLQQFLAGLDLHGCDPRALARRSGLRLARVRGIEAGDAVSEGEAALLSKVLRSAGVAFQQSPLVEGVRVRGRRRPRFREWLERLDARTSRRGPGR